MKKSDLKIIKIKNKKIGRCVNCQARDYCGINFSCDCKMDEHYINVKLDRKNKIKKIYGSYILEST
jgi:hypothetical protein